MDPRFETVEITPTTWLATTPLAPGPGPEPGTENVFAGIRQPLLGQGRDDPWKYLCLLQTSWPSGPVTVGTGWLISGNTVVTAGHNIFRPGPDPMACSGVRVAFGFDGSAPPVATAMAAQLKVSKGWHTGDARADCGAIRLSQTLPALFGPDFLEPVETPDIVACSIAGYPTDLFPFGLYVDRGEARRTADGFVEHRISTEGGESGAPLLMFQGNRPVVVGMHLWGDPVRNLAMLLSPSAVSTLRSWRV
jgi:glutamyl endopeptidase